ncbi:hypothetical protein M0804_000420 [Polistes exclamans]|nr:hypothetical protein M0804_000420 [Polistes exclamans]
MATWQNSPSDLPTEFILKYHSQLNRLRLLNSMLEELSIADTATLSDVEVDLEHIERIHQEFTATHEFFELNLPASFLNHAYFAENVHQQEAKTHQRLRLALNKVRRLLEIEHPSPAAEPRVESNLSGIQLKSFSGEYADWPGFKKMFESLILKNERISEIGRLHYLRSCMQGVPAQLIANFPLTVSSLQPSWELLNARYENKRLLIQAQLDRLCRFTPLTSKSATGLNWLISTVSEARKALESLGVVENLGDLILVHHVVRQLDHSTREDWETSLGSSREYPTFKQVEDFVNSQARTLEHIETTPAQSSAGKTQPTIPQSQQSKKSATANQATTHQESSQSDARFFYCDCCEGKHFIVTCPKFRKLNIIARRSIVIDAKLCYNCLGRHKANLCRTSLRCKRCGAKHHTMLHDPACRQQTTKRLHSTSSSH